MQDENFDELNWKYPGNWEGSVEFSESDAFGAALALAEDDEQSRDVGPRKKLAPTRRQIEAKAMLKEKAKEMGCLAGILVGIAMPIFQRLMQGRNKQGTSGTSSGNNPRRQSTKITIRITSLDENQKPSESQPPSEAQRNAWKSFAARGPAVWDELVQRVMPVYQLQWPMRSRVWKSIYGEVGYERHLPEITNSDELKRLVRPSIFFIASDRDTDSVDIGIAFSATWHMDGFGALIRDGKVFEVGHPGVAHSEKPVRQDRFEHSVFGALARIPDQDPWELIDQWQMPTEPGTSGFANAKRGGPHPWEGYVRCDPFLQFASVADKKAEFLNHDPHADRPSSSMAWEYANGTFEIRVYADRDALPSEAQAQAFADFHKNKNVYVPEIVKSIFEKYQRECKTNRENWKDRYVDDLIPVLKNSEGLNDRMQLRCIHIHPGNAEIPVTIALQFVCTWNYDGFTAFFRNGCVERFGMWNDARLYG